MFYIYKKNINHLHMCYYFSYLFTQVFIDLNSIYYIYFFLFFVLVTGNYIKILYTKKF